MQGPFTVPGCPQVLRFDAVTSGTVSAYLCCRAWSATGTLLDDNLEGVPITASRPRVLSSPAQQVSRARGGESRPARRPHGRRRSRMTSHVWLAGPRQPRGRALPGPRGQEPAGRATSTGERGQQPGAPFPSCLIQSCLIPFCPARSLFSLLPTPAWFSPIQPDSTRFGPGSARLDARRGSLRPGRVPDPSRGKSALLPERPPLPSPAAYLRMGEGTGKRRGKRAPKRG